MINVNKIISTERLEPYLKHHQYDLNTAIYHYKLNILISESFYPYLALIEVGLRNTIDFQMQILYKDENWFENNEFKNIATNFQLNKIIEAKATILSGHKEINHGQIISELSFGFWTSLFDLKFELNLWKSLRFVFNNCPKELRKRKIISVKLNKIRKLRNRIFHHESISWNIEILKLYKFEIIEILNWLDKDLNDWIIELNHFDKIIEENKHILG